MEIPYPYYIVLTKNQTEFFVDEACANYIRNAMQQGECVDIVDIFGAHCAFHTDGVVLRERTATNIYREWEFGETVTNRNTEIVKEINGGKTWE